MLIYVITNTVNGKIYIGLTCGTLAKRWRVHVKDAKRGSNQRIHKAIRRYGADRFTIEELARAESREELDKLERFYILAFESYPPSRNIGYNMTEGGEGYRASYPARKVTRGWHHTEEARQRISLGHMGNKSWKGKRHSKESCEKISRTLKKREWKPSEKWLAAREAQNGKERPELRGRKQSPEAREKKRQAALKRWAATPKAERQQHMEKAHAGKGKDWRKKLAAAQKKHWQDPAYRAEQSAAQREGWKKKQASA
jgi:group I intron endonuclease